MKKAVNNFIWGMILFAGIYSVWQLLNGPRQGLSKPSDVSSPGEKDPEQGKNIFLSHCSACHSYTKGGGHKLGPNLYEVYERKAGTAEGYGYSKELKESGIFWTEENLDRWLTDPQKIVPGSKMFYLIADEKKRKDLIDFLKQNK